MHEVNLLKVKGRWGRDPCDFNDSLSLNSVYPNFRFLGTFLKGTRDFIRTSDPGFSFLWMHQDFVSQVSVNFSLF